MTNSSVVSQVILGEARAEGSASLIEQFLAVRKQSIMLIENLNAEDMQAQSMPDASPIKWHLAHTSWFFETFILQHHSREFRWYNESFCHLFNSYYNSVGSKYFRPQRGLLTRPSLTEILNYREYIEEKIVNLLENLGDEIGFLTVVGLHHEMQHQELMQTDVLHLLSNNPLFPQVHQESWLTENLEALESSTAPKAIQMQRFEPGLIEVGASSVSLDSSLGIDDFHYDCESPKHPVYLSSYALSHNLVTNSDWLSFMEDGGYSNSLLWLSDGWDQCQKSHWSSPLYWHKKEGVWHQFGLDGLRPVRKDAPVCHISYYEADAFARWAGKRLPSEHELEFASQGIERKGNFLESKIWRPMPCVGSEKVSQLYGDVWEWTHSPFMPYPGFAPELGALGEYNGKFMANQYVLKGGSCATPENQMRATYRNFFYPHQRWQYSGLRLAEDI